MALNYIAARTLLKQFIAQQTQNCPSFFCPEVATIGLSYATPTVVSGQAEDVTVPRYWTFELRTSASDVVAAHISESAIALPSGVREAPGYERDIIGEIKNGQIVEHLRKMTSPTTDGSNNTEYTANDDIIVLGENTSTVPGSGDDTKWPTANYFILCNNDGTMDGLSSSTTATEGVINSGTNVGVRFSTHLVLFGTITSGGSQGATVAKDTVPLFRKNNFKLIFSST